MVIPPSIIFSVRRFNGVDGPSSHYHGILNRDTLSGDMSIRDNTDLTQVDILDFTGQ